MNSTNPEVTAIREGEDQKPGRKPFVEPEISAPENVLDVTAKFSFQVFTVDTGDAP